MVADGPRDVPGVPVPIEGAADLRVLEVVTAGRDVTGDAQPGAVRVDPVQVVEGLAEVGQVALDIADDVEPDRLAPAAVAVPPDWFLSKC